MDELKLERSSCCVCACECVCGSRLFFLEVERIKAFLSRPPPLIPSVRAPSLSLSLFSSFFSSFSALVRARVSRQTQSTSAGPLSRIAYCGRVYLVTAGWLHHITGPFVRKPSQAQTPLSPLASLLLADG